MDGAVRGGWDLYLDRKNISKKVNRKVQGMPQSQTAANPRHKEEEKKDKNIHAQNKQMYEKHKDSSLFPKRGDQNAKNKRRNEDKEHEKT